MIRFKLKTVINFFLLLAPFFSSAVGQESSLPCPDELKPVVEFWVKVFSKYTINQMVIHDGGKPDRIYRVVDFDEYEKAGKLSPEEREHVLHQEKAEIVKILKNLSVGDPRPENLIKKEYTVFRLFGNRPKPRDFSQAIPRIRIQRGMKDAFQEGLVRSGQYLDAMKAIFDEYDLPADLVYLPHIESSFHPFARSNKGAAGVWQFTRPTGKRFLRIDDGLDERYDPLKATRAAARLLKEQREQLGNWPLAVTAYNHGVSGLKRAMRKTGSTDLAVFIRQYRSRNFGFASKNFYVELLAAARVARNPSAYFGDIVPEPPWMYQTVVFPKDQDLESVLGSLSLDRETFLSMNPVFAVKGQNAEVVVPKAYEVRIPAPENPFLAAASATDIADDEKSLRPWSRFVNGIGHALFAWTQPSGRTGSSRRMERQDQTVLKPTRETSSEDKQETGSGRETLVSSPDDFIREKPRQIAEASVDFNKENLQQNAETPKPSTEEKIQDTAGSVVHSPEGKQPSEERTPVLFGFPPAWTRVAGSEKNPILDPESGDPLFLIENGMVVVQAEETLGHYADWLEIPISRLRTLNNVYKGHSLWVGQRFALLFESVTQDTFLARRQQYHQQLRNSFFRNYRIGGSLVYTLRQGETLWDVAVDRYKVPLWLLLAFNQSRDPYRTTPGEPVLIPRIEAVDWGSPDG